MAAAFYLYIFALSIAQLHMNSSIRTIREYCDCRVFFLVPFLLIFILCMSSLFSCFFSIYYFSKIFFFLVYVTFPILYMKLTICFFSTFFPDIVVAICFIHHGNGYSIVNNTFNVYNALFAIQFGETI